MKYRTVKVNDKWYVQIKDENSKYWKYLTYSYMDGSFSTSSQFAMNFSFYTENNAISYIKKKVKPYYQPIIQIGKEISFLTVTEKEKCMFDLMKKMLEAESNDDIVLAKKYNDELLKIHNINKNEEPIKKKKWYHIF